jgi:hypothetical protein
MSNIPDFQTLPIGEEGVSDEFLLLACDGLWDVIDAEDAVRVTRDLLFEKKWPVTRRLPHDWRSLLFIWGRRTTLPSSWFVFFNRRKLKETVVSARNY